MTWYLPFLSFLSGLFLANTVPHFVKGISGDPFPSPFSKPPGKGLSSPLLNMIWSLFNLIVGHFLFVASGVSLYHLNASLISFYIAVAFIGIMLAVHFEKKDKENRK